MSGNVQKLRKRDIVVFLCKIQIRIDLQEDLMVRGIQLLINDVFSLPRKLVRKMENVSGIREVMLHLLLGKSLLVLINLLLMIVLRIVRIERWTVKILFLIVGQKFLSLVVNQKIILPQIHLHQNGYIQSFVVLEVLIVVVPRNEECNIQINGRNELLISILRIFLTWICFMSLYSMDQYIQKMVLNEHQNLM